MSAIPTTSTTLLKDLAKDSQHARWGEFVARYRPMMESYMHERFPTLDADDVIQETLIAVCRIMPSYRYDPDAKGHFHNYLTGILRHRALRMADKERRRGKVAASLKVVGGVDTAATADSADAAWRDAVFKIALRQFLADASVADRTKRIFERTAINGESPESVATAFKMKRHTVDQAKSRALARIREIVRQLESAADE
jgi:RNA polymerase sigma factor (sigma-70 family)